MALDTKFINDYNGVPIHLAGSIVIGIGTFRRYMNSSTTTLLVGDYGVSRWFALTAIQDTVFDSIQDREVAVGTSSLSWAGESTGSAILNSITFSAGTTIYGDFSNIKLTSGTALIYGI